ncbi:hypothetical protein [Luteimicrobium sp. DT211]|uniref:hypothetical protein n=1 Tax=Luteimicrobium sp. DT211 TaxID=3393412 RepID=UPI003CF00730
MAGIAFAAVALATTGAASGSAPTAQTGKMCTVAAETGAERCFDTISEALESITGVPITDPAVDAGDHAAFNRAVEHGNAVVLANRKAALAGPSLDSDTSLTATRSAVAAASSDVTLGAVWKDRDWKGYGKVFYGVTGSGCYATTYGFPHTRDYGYNDNISSITSYNNCATTLYKDSSYGGTSRTYQGDTAYVGDTMNDETSSIVYRPRS